MPTLMQHASDHKVSQGAARVQLVMAHVSPISYHANRDPARPIVSHLYAPVVSAEVGAVHVDTLSSKCLPLRLYIHSNLMSALQNRKRPNPDGTAQDSPPTKRIKSDSAVQVASNFPPEFWDSLSKVWLTPRALREKDRRNSLRSPAAPIIKTAATLARFARRGGPDLGHLRGYPEPEHTAEMNPNRSSVPSTRRTKSTNATNGPPKVKRSSAYDRDFEQKLVDCSIYPKGHEFYRNDLPEPDNLDDITRTLSAPRGSLSPSRFDQTAFKNFTLTNDRVLAENVRGQYSFH
ncbi:hypothetical protein ACQRIT_000807 [Beauveria bassiana]